MTTIDVRGHRCPVPTLRLQTALAALAPGATVQLLADDPMARIDVPHFAGQNGHEVVASAERDGYLAFTIRKAG